MGACLLVAVLNLARQGQGTVMAGAGLRRCAQGGQRFTKAVECLAFTGAVTQIAEQRVRPPVDSGSLLVAALAADQRRA